ncbi:MAG TPA: Mrp/NBP35 family ATP-binding protein [Ignavibacteria bacterium]|nr:Mrp/NBP35 family ATP-binding protein [Ignavibacteria bacterium]HMR38890.1 Mrp/NBP35 family ATP-binding protein [Ignavibacteria bacterium]
MTEDKIKEVLSKVKEPVLNVDFVKLGFVNSISLNGNDLKLTLGISEIPENVRSETIEIIKNEFKKSLPGINSVEVTFVQGITEHVNEKKSSVLPGIKNTIAVASGKGGVGKSTIAVNIAVALAEKGFKVGLIDADIYGPSIPLMFDLKGKPGITKVGDKNKLVPMEKYGVKVMSIGFLMEADTAVVWRGPMASSALKQFMADVVWGDLDFLLFDMPPGTGDIQLTLSQTIPLTGAVIVSTPQEISIADAKKGYIMFEKVNVPTLGIIENMSYYINPDGSKEFIFGKDGGRKMADEFNVNLLGEIPVNTKIRAGGDEGKPSVLTDKDSEEIFGKIASDVIKEINKKNTERVNTPDVVIEI